MEIRRTSDSPGKPPETQTLPGGFVIRRAPETPPGPTPSETASTRTRGFLDSLRPTRMAEALRDNIKNAAKSSWETVKNPLTLTFLGGVGARLLVAHLLNTDMSTVDGYFKLISVLGTAGLVGLEIANKTIDLENRMPKAARIIKNVAIGATVASLGWNVERASENVWAPPVAAGAEQEVGQKAEPSPQSSSSAEQPASQTAPAGEGGTPSGAVGTEGPATSGEAPLLTAVTPEATTTPTPTETLSPSPTETAAPSPSPTATSGPSPSPTSTVTPNPTPTVPPTPTEAPTASPAPLPIASEAPAEPVPTPPPAQVEAALDATSPDTSINNIVPTTPPAEQTFPSAPEPTGEAVSAANEIAEPLANAPAETLSSTITLNGAEISGSVADGSLTYNGHHWSLLDSGVKNIHNLFNEVGQQGQVNTQALAENLQKATDLWAHDQLHQSSHPDLYKLFHLSNGTGSDYLNLLDNDTFDTLKKLGVIVGG